MQPKLNIVITATSKGLQTATRKASSEIRSGFKKSRQAVKAFNDTVGNGHRALGSLSGSLKTLFAGVGLSKVVSGLFDAGTESQRLSRSFEAIKSDGKKAGDELDFVRRSAEKLGLEFYSTADAYKGILAAAEGTALEGKQTRDIFQSIAEASTALGLSSDQTAGALNALSQMISKGNVQAEELRGQLGERLPGAFQLAAKAMGISTQELNKMLDNGEVLATDLLPKLARVLHEKYGKAALDASQDATQGLNRFKTAWKDMKAKVAASGFMDAITETLKQLTLLFKDKAFLDAISQLGKMLGDVIQTVVEFVVEWKGVLAALALTVGAIAVVSKLAVIIKGLGAAFTVMTGSSMLVWLGSLKTAFVAVAAQAGLAGMAMKAGLAAAAAWGAVQIVRAIKGLYEWRKAANAATEATKDMLASTDRTMNKLEEFKDYKPPTKDLTGWAQKDLDSFEQSLRNAEGYWVSFKFSLQEKAKKKTLLGTSTDEARAAQKELVGVDARIQDIRENLKQVGEATAGPAKIMRKPTQAVEATKDMLDEFEQKAKAAYENASKEAAKYAKEVIAWEEKIKYARLSTEDKIRELGRKGLEDEQAWLDKRKQAEEKLYDAKEALRNEDYQLAEKLAKDAEGLYADLAEEVKGTKAGKDVVVKSIEDTKKVAIEGVQAVGTFIEDLYGQQKNAAETARDEWQQSADGIKKELDEIARQREANVKIELKGLSAAQNAINKLIKPATKKITVITENKTVNAKQTGGIVSLSRGAKLPGYGGGDRIQALLEAGEFVIRKEAVRRYGAGLFQALNAMKYDVNDRIKARLGGMISNISLPAMPTSPLAFQTGGGVPFAGKPTESMTLRFQAGNVEMPITAQGPAGVTRRMVKQFERELIKMGMAKR